MDLPIILLPTPEAGQVEPEVIQMGPQVPHHLAVPSYCSWALWGLCSRSFRLG